MTKGGIFPDVKSENEREEGSVFAPNFDAHGLLPVVVTSAQYGEVLMFAYMNEEALARTIETGEAHYWSRSRQELWRKGKTSGNRQRVVEMRTDCDQDALWLKVEMTGTGACCHTGRVSCFYRSVPIGAAAPGELMLSWVDAESRFDPEAVYGHGDAAKGTLKTP
ncbi:MAG: phosphoribosyl-AMP cyclohydrolase [Methyloceanibacter sp.]